MYEEHEIDNQKWFPNVRVSDPLGQFLLGVRSAQYRHRSLTLVRSLQVFSLPHTVVVRAPQSQQSHQSLAGPSLHDEPVWRLGYGGDVEEPEDGEAGEHQAGDPPVEAQVGGNDGKAEAEVDQNPGTAVDGGSDIGRGDLTDVAGYGGVLHPTGQAVQHLAEVEDGRGPPQAGTEEPGGEERTDQQDSDLAAQVGGHQTSRDLAPDHRDTEETGQPDHLAGAHGDHVAP